MASLKYQNRAFFIKMPYFFDFLTLFGSGDG